MPAKALELWKQSALAQLPGVRFINGYGPTEVTVHTTMYDAPDAFSLTTVPIGRPLPSRTCYILDRHQQPTPIGVAGELHIGGTGLARGYLNHPELTAEKFIPNPFSGAVGERLYKTGDLARYQADGNIEFLGRLDHQVKIRGFRIELGEVEAALVAQPSIRDAVVMPRGEGAERQLVAYIVAREDGHVPPGSDAASAEFPQDLAIVGIYEPGAGATPGVHARELSGSAPGCSCCAQGWWRQRRRGE